MTPTAGTLVGQLEGSYPPPPAARCYCCGAACHPVGDHCHGCGRVVCVDCSVQYHHDGKPGRHWRVVRPDGPTEPPA